jgi:hypothetical protein
MSVPKEVTIITVEEELPGVKSYAARHNWEIEWDKDALILTFAGQHPNDGTKIQVVADLQGYRALPPAWLFRDPSTTTHEKIFFPKPGTGRGIQGSIFHGSNRICAPFNRLAYREHGGPHSNWGGPECWLNVKNHIREIYIAGMFASIIGHLRVSPGMKK